MSLCELIGAFRALSVRNQFVHKAVCGCYQNQFYSSKIPHSIVKEKDPITGEIKKRKTTQIPKITLLSGDNIQVTTLSEAEKLSKRRDLRLVKIVDLDTKSNRPVYKLMSGAEYHSEELKQRELRKKAKADSNYIKGEKVLMLNSHISDHDLQVYLKKTLKWISKMYEVRTVISFNNSNADQAEKIYKSFEEYYKNEGIEAKLVQKRQKGTDMKFQILPPNQNNNNKALEL